LAAGARGNLLAGAFMLETLTDPQETGIRIGFALNAVGVTIDVVG
jgi:hypothetical protein